MGKRKVIEDSDDEDGADTTPPPQLPLKTPQHSTCIEPENEITMVPDHLDPSAGPSTASTGLALILKTACLADSQQRG